MNQQYYWKSGMVSLTSAFLLLTMLAGSAAAGPGSATPEAKTASPVIRRVTGTAPHLLPSLESKTVRVAVSSNDTRFHSLSCPRLKEPEKFLSVDAAMLSGYGPCPRCSGEVLAQMPQAAPKVPRGPVRAAARSNRLSGGPPFIVIVSPQRRVVNTFPF